MSWKLWLPQQSAPMKQSFEDNCVPKLELGNEADRRDMLPHVRDVQKPVPPIG
jgi:hypothetical protein